VAISGNLQSGRSVVARDLGRILQALGGLVFVSLVVPLVWREFYVLPAMIVSGLIPLGLGTVLFRRYRDAENPNKLHGMIIAASGWFVVAVFGSLPFLLIAWTIRLDPALLNVPTFTGRAASTLAAFERPLNALFESMSGFTGTGLTMTDDESALPATLQWWRTFSEWVGGVGVIVLTTAILARPGSGSLTLYESEARSEKIHPSIVSTVRTIWWIFLLFTFGSILLLWLVGMPLWDAINHGMTGLATGGFSITDNSIATYDSAAIDYALLPIMTLGAIAFPVHYLVLQGDLSHLYEDLQTRWVFISFIGGTAGLVGLLLLNGTYDSAEAALRYGSFQFVSAMSCAGFQTAGDLGTTWTAESQLAVSLGMVIGAAAGSTVGGIKLIRTLTLSKGILFRVRDVFYPEGAVRHFTLNGRDNTPEESSREFEEAAIVAFLWFFFLGVATLVFLLSVSDEYTLANVIFEVASAQGNVGLSSGITGPGMPDVTKVMFLFNMWIGRLEIIPVLVLLRSLVYGGVES
jgi:trk system potassium uptake protein TrkH